MLLSVRMDKKFIQSFLSFLYCHPHLQVSQSFQFRETRLQPSVPWQPLQCIKLFIADLQQQCWQRGVGRGVLQQQQKWNNTKTQQLKNSPTVTLHLKLADKAETTSVPLAILAEALKKNQKPTPQ